MPLERVSQGFKDISMSFQNNPLNADLIGLKNENAIARSLKILYLLFPERNFLNQTLDLEFCSLFETMDDITGDIINDEIRNQLMSLEPRVNLLDVIIPGIDNNAFDVTIKYEVIGADVPPQQLEFALQPTR